MNRLGFAFLAALIIACGCSKPAAPSGTSSAGQTSASDSKPFGSASSLKTVDITKGKYTGDKAKEYTVEPGDTVNVQYTGWLTNGKEFDSNDPKYAADPSNVSPLNFVVGEGTVVPGFDKGVVGMQLGQTRDIIIPPDLGYGAKGSPPKIPANSTLKFEVKLLGLVKSDGPGVFDTSDVKTGSGAAAKSGDVVTISFTADLLNGRQVLDSNSLGDLTFQVKTGKMSGGKKLGAIGLAYGVEGMKVGGERKITLPPSISLTARGASQGIPINSILVFDVKLTKIAPASSLK